MNLLIFVCIGCTRPPINDGSMKFDWADGKDACPLHYIPIKALNHILPVGMTTTTNFTDKIKMISKWMLIICVAIDTILFSSNHCHVNEHQCELVHTIFEWKILLYKIINRVSYQLSLIIPYLLEWLCTKVLLRKIVYTIECCGRGSIFLHVKLYCANRFHVQIWQLLDNGQKEKKCFFFAFLTTWAHMAAVKNVNNNKFASYSNYVDQNRTIY